MTNRSLEKQGSELCQSCGLCCNGVVCDETDISPKEDKEFADHFVEKIVVGQDGKSFWINQPCPAFRGNCNHYEIRPLDCKTYQCHLLKRLLSNEITIEYALNIVRLTLITLDKITAQYNATAAQSLSRDEIYPVLKKIHQEAQASDLQKQFWRSYPDYLTFYFLRKKHFIE